LRVLTLMYPKIERATTLRAALRLPRGSVCLLGNRGGLGAVQGFSCQAQERLSDGLR